MARTAGNAAAPEEIPTRMTGPAGTKAPPGLARRSPDGPGTGDGARGAAAGHKAPGRGTTKGHIIGTPA